MVNEPIGVESARDLVVGREVSGVCFVRDFVELLFDGPILRAISHPYGMFGCEGWRFPEGDAAAAMLGYIGTVVDGFRLTENGYLSVDSFEHNFAVPLEESARRGPEAAHVVGAGEDGRTDAIY